MMIQKIILNKYFNDNLRNQKPEAIVPLNDLVELAGIEPASKHIPQKLSTCLFHYYLSA